MLNVFDGRKELVNELRQAPKELKQFVSKEINKLFKNRNFEYAIASTAQSDADRRELITHRLKGATGIV